MDSEKKSKVKISAIGAMDMLKFKNLADERKKVIEKTPATPINADYIINKSAKLNHPDYQEMIIEDIKPYPAANAKTFILKRADGEAAAMFRAGQYITIAHDIDSYKYIRPYSIMSSPKDAENGRYEITIKAFEGGFTSVYAVRNYNIGDRINVSGPQGYFYHEELRDGNNVVAVIGGGSITVALSMARAIRDGYEDFNFTIIYGADSQSDVLCPDVLKNIEENCDKVKIVYVIKNERLRGCEYGYITSDIIKKYAGEDYSLLVCGPPQFTEYMHEEVKKLNLPERKIRYELKPVPPEIWNCKGYPTECKGKRYKLSVRQGEKEFRVSASANEPLMVAFERARIKAPVSCRSGVCGFCRSKLLSGTVFVPYGNDGRRAADKDFGYIHPCASYPTSDIIIEIPLVYIDAER